MTAIPDVPGCLSADELKETASSIAEWQLRDGMIPWFPGGHADPWNHVEAAMALDVAGLRGPADAAYQWLVDRQRPDGSWHNYYVEGGVSQDRLDANCTAYVATGVWHRYLLSGDLTFVETMWPTVEAAIDFVVDMQTDRGEVIWARHSDGTFWSFALLTGSASTSHSIRAAIAVAGLLGHERPRWSRAAAKLMHVVANEPDAFAPKDRWAMDWYYPVLSGALTGDRGRARLAEREHQFAVPDHGIRCVSDRDWVTTAETCECAIAHLSVGNRDRALELFESVQEYRDNHGRYFTGVAYPGKESFPDEERSTYSAAAVVLAADALCGTTSASAIFTDHDLLPRPASRSDARSVSPRSDLGGSVSGGPIPQNLE